MCVCFCHQSHRRSLLISPFNPGLSRNQSHDESNSEPSEVLACVCVCVSRHRVYVEWIDGVMWCDSREEKERLSSRVGLLTLTARLVKDLLSHTSTDVKNTHTHAFCLFIRRTSDALCTNIQRYLCLCWSLMLIDGAEVCRSVFESIFTWNGTSTTRLSTLFLQFSGMYKKKSSYCDAPA